MLFTGLKVKETKTPSAIYEGNVLLITLARMTEDNEGIFLFKNSKSKLSNESIFSFPTVDDSENSMLEIANEFFNDGKWMQAFLKRILRPSLLCKPVVFVSREQVIKEGLALSVHENDGLVSHLSKKVRRVTRGNRRHKIQTRKSRRTKWEKKNK